MPEVTTTEFTRDELIYMHNCTSAHRYVLRSNDYPDKMEQVYTSCRAKMSMLLAKFRGGVGLGGLN